MSSHSEEYNKKAVEAAERKSKIYEDTIKELQQEERYVNFLNGYHPKSVESFIKNYAWKKSFWYDNAEQIEINRRNTRDRYYNMALYEFKEIYKKKLFNIMCHWVAGEMDLPGIEVSTDFQVMAKNPSLCTFMEPISAKEFECYMQFLQSKDWQPDASDIYEEDENEEEEYSSAESALSWYHNFRSLYIERYIKDLPLWFHFYDKCFGTDNLLTLPCIRTDLEAKYHEIWTTEIYVKTLTPEQQKTFTHYSIADRKLHSVNKEKKKEYVEQNRLKYEEQKRNQPNYEFFSVSNENIMSELLQLIETPEVIKLYKADKKYYNRASNHDWIDCDLIYLQEAKEMIPIRSNRDYRDAISEAYNDYEHKKKCELLPVIFENYRHCIDSGKPFDWLNGEEPGTWGNDMHNRIIAARKFLGEPENLDFLKKENLKFE